MAKVKISEFNSNPALNTDIDSINIAEGCSPSGINDAIRELMAQLKDWQSGTSNDPYVVGSSGSLTLNQGTANTVPYLNGSKVVTSGTALTFDGSNLGVGVTPSAWGSGYKAIQISPRVGLFGNSSDSIVGNNLYNDGTNWKYIASATGALYLQGSGIHAWYQAASGTAGGTASLTQAMTLDASGRLGIATTSPDNGMLTIFKNTAKATESSYGIAIQSSTSNAYTELLLGADDTVDCGVIQTAAKNTNFTGKNLALQPQGGNLLVGKTTSASAETTVGCLFTAGGRGFFTANGEEPLFVNRLTNDGTLVVFTQAGTTEGTISVSGTTVSYNGGHLSRWAQTTTAKDESLVKGTVLSNLDAMNVYTDAEGNPVDNEQLNKVKVSDTEGDINVAGVFVNWTHDDAHNVDEINMAMTGDMIIRIAQGTTVARGDLLMSAGDGTAKPQGDDIVRSKTIAKVTSNHVTCTYADGSYCVPCVLMAC